MPESDEWRIFFYKSVRGDSPPLEYVQNLDAPERAKVVRTLALLRDLGTAIGMPHAKHLTGTDLWELRPDAHRLIYVAMAGRRFFILHAFRKTSSRTKDKDIAIALSRRDDLLGRLG